MRKQLVYVVAGAVTVAAVAAINAVYVGRLDELDIQVLLTSLGFSIFSATGAAGGSLARARSGAPGALGWLTVLLSAVSLLLLVAAVWEKDLSTARAFGVTALITLAASHASIVLRAQRYDDSVAIRALAALSILFAVFDCGGTALVIAGELRHVSDDTARLAAAVAIAMLATTALPPILRMAGDGRSRDVPPPPGSSPFRSTGIAAALVLAAGSVAFLYVQSTEPHDPVARPAYAAAPTQYATPAVAPPPMQFADAQAHMRRGVVRALDSQIYAGAVFRCPTRSGPVETLGAGSNVQLRRDAGGICLRFKDPALAQLPNNGAAAMTLGFRNRKWRSNPRTLWIALRTSGSEAPWSLVIGPINGPTQSVTAGNIGVARDQASILIAGSELPGWVLDRRRSEWKVQTY
jgi:hypothetical protein